MNRETTSENYLYSMAYRFEHPDAVRHIDLTEEEEILLKYRAKNGPAAAELVPSPVSEMSLEGSA